jgi:hypothetical protein
MIDIETVTCYERSVKHIRQTDTINRLAKAVRVLFFQRRAEKGGKLKA